MHQYNEIAIILPSMNKLQQICTFANMIIMVLLIVTIALQNKSSGLSTVFGGGGVVQTRRGFEKWLFYSTVILGILFAGLSITTIVVA
jgi:protein translocase SecG subunit